MKRLICTLLILLFSCYGSSYAAEIPLANGGFEELAPGVQAAEALGQIPYQWDLYANTTKDYWSVGLSDQVVFSGEFSVLISDNSPDQGLMLRCVPVAVTPGQDYMALVNIFNVKEEPFENHLQVYMEFWSEHGWDPTSRKEWDRSKRVGVSWGNSKSFGEWEELTLTATAPANANYVTVGLYCHNAGVIKAYADEIRLGVRD